MSAEAAIWLPADLATRDPIRARVQSVVAEWGARWFPRHGARMASLDAVSARGANAAGAESWVVPCKAVGVSCSKATRLRMTAWALDLAAEPVGLSPVDTALLERLQARLFEDLVQTLETALHIDEPAKETAATSPFESLGGAVAAITDTRGSALLLLAIPTASVAQLCQSSLPASRRTAKQLASRLTALGETPVRLEARLGRADVGLNDLRCLAAGDVLVLNSRTEDPIELALANGGRVVGRAMLSEVDGQISLTVQA